MRLVTPLQYFMRFTFVHDLIVLRFFSLYRSYDIMNKSRLPFSRKQNKREQDTQTTHFCSTGFDLDPMTLIYELDLQ